MTTASDIRFYFDPVCPFAWMTSKWVRLVADQRDYRVDWRFISLRIINEKIDYAAHFPPGYDEGHTAGKRLLRVAAQVRQDHGAVAVGDFYAACGARIFDTAGTDDADNVGERERRGTRDYVEPILERAGLPIALAAALDDERHDELIRAESDEALTLTGRDVGTPIIHFEPPAGVAFFGPVISRLPSPEDAVRLWDHVVGLASFPGFAELKRSLREKPQLAAFGLGPDDAGTEEDWHAGSRRTR